MKLNRFSVSAVLWLVFVILIESAPAQFQFKSKNLAIAPSRFVDVPSLILIQNHLRILNLLQIIGIISSRPCPNGKSRDPLGNCRAGWGRLAASWRIIRK